MVFAPYEIVSWDTDQFSAKFTDDEIDFDFWWRLPGINYAGLLPRSHAPKDGNWFLVIESESLQCELACWYGEKFSSADVSDEIDFDLWMPLPAPPEDIL